MYIGNYVRDRFIGSNFIFKAHSDDELLKSPDKPFQVLMAL